MQFHQPLWDSLGNAAQIQCGRVARHLSQRDSLGVNKETNWLPRPPSDPFNLTIRVYQPRRTLLDGTYKNLPIKKVS